MTAVTAPGEIPTTSPCPEGGGTELWIAAGGAQSVSPAATDEGGVEEPQMSLELPTPAIVSTATTAIPPTNHLRPDRGRAGSESAESSC